MERVTAEGVVAVCELDVEGEFGRTCIIIAPPPCLCLLASLERLENFETAAPEPGASGQQQSGGGFTPTELAASSS